MSRLTLDGAYWDTATSSQRAALRTRAWREYCDALHRDLVTAWSGGRARRALKTDLYDEAAGAGLIGRLERIADAVHGVDIAPTVIEEAAGANRALRGVRADVRRLPYADQSFDLVVSNSTLDHFSRPSDIGVALREIHRVTAAGGTLVITMDNRANPVIWLRSVLPYPLLRSLRIVPYFVGATLTDNELAAELVRAGFRVEQFRIIMHVPRVVAMVACRVVDLVRAERASRALRRLLLTAEGMEHLPTRRRTGYYVAALGRR